MSNLNTIRIRVSAMHQMPHFFLICAFYARPPKAFTACMLPHNELMADPPGDPFVTMAEMEAYILDFLMFSSEIVASSADFSHLFLFHSFQLGQPLCRVVEILLLRLAASRVLRISS